MLFTVNVGSCFPVTQRSVLSEWELGALGILSWEWVSDHLHDGLLGSWQLGLPTVPGTQKKQHAVLLSCCYKKVGLLINSEPDLRGNRKGISILVPTDLRAAQQWMQWSFLSSFPSWKSPTLRTRISGSLFFTKVPAALEWVIQPRVQFPTSWMREIGLAPGHLI